MITILEKLERLEGKYGMAGTVLGIFIIVTCMVATILTMKFFVECNLKVIAWVCENLWGFKLY